MKALSINQPYGWLITQGYKSIENRNWNTKFRGEFLIHVGLKTAWDDLDWCERNLGWNGGDMPTYYKTGGVIGYANLVDVVTESKAAWFTGRYGFILENMTQLPFRPCKGQLGFFTPDYNSIYAKDKPKPLPKQRVLI